MPESIGIIGGADGPTVIYIAGPRISSAAVFAAVIIISVIGLIIVKHRHK